MRVVDDVLLERFADLPFAVHDSFMDVENDGQVVTYPMPYAVYYSSVGDDDNRRLSGRKGRRSVFFTLTYVGLDRNQTKWAGELLRDTLQGRRIHVPGHKTWLCELLESQRIRRDDEAVRPDGSPVFYGVDNYALSITLTPA